MSMIMCVVSECYLELQIVMVMARMVRRSNI